MTASYLNSIAEQTWHQHDMGKEGFWNETALPGSTRSIAYLLHT